MSHDDGEVNGAPRTVDVEADTPVFWMLRDEPG